MGQKWTHSFGWVGETWKKERKSGSKTPDRLVLTVTTTVNSVIVVFCDNVPEKQNWVRVVNAKLFSRVLDGLEEPERKGGSNTRERFSDCHNHCKFRHCDIHWMCPRNRIWRLEVQNDLDSKPLSAQGFSHSKSIPIYTHVYGWGNKWKKFPRPTDNRTKRNKRATLPWCLEWSPKSLFYSWSVALVRSFLLGSGIYLSLNCYHMCHIPPAQESSMVNFHTTGAED